MKSVLLIALIAFGCQSTLAQEQLKPADTPDSTVNERIRVLESELERQNNKLDQLQKTIGEQQQAIQALLEKLNAQPAASVTAGPPDTSVTSVAAVAATESAKAEPQTPTAEKRLDKVENDIKKFGPLRLSGDFRLRFD